MTGDIAGIAFFVLLIVGAYFGLRALSKPRVTSAEDFERNAAEGSTLLGSGMNALHEMLNPEAAKAKEVQTQLKEGRYGKKRREGKANGTEEDYDGEEN